MVGVIISLPDGLYAELCEVSKATHESGYGPEHWATDLVAAELAARRLPRISPGTHGPRIKTAEPEPYRVLLPDDAW